MNGNYLILGSKGTLGQELAKIMPGATAWDREDADVTDFENLKVKIKALNPLPEAIIYCAAFNDVDGAEIKKEVASMLNTAVPTELAEFCKQLDIPLVYFSTNYVFDGIKGYYIEKDVPNPISTYGLTKYLGELGVSQNADKFYIIRTAVLFGPKGTSPASKKSFVDLMLGLAQENMNLKVITDEVNSLTYAKDLAAAVSKILEDKMPYGIYHITNSGSASWYELALEIFNIKQLPVTLIKVPASDFRRLARRPGKAVLENTKFYEMRPWQEALREYLGASL
jgi:dTDP-4-dehydrorhamnose reductase